MTLFSHVIDGLNENAAMNDLDHWFDGFSSGQDAIEIYGDSFTGETLDDEMAATIKAIDEMFQYDVDDIQHSAAQLIIEEWNVTVWGQDFQQNGHSVPFC